MTKPWSGVAASVVRIPEENGSTLERHRDGSVDFQMSKNAEKTIRQALQKKVQARRF